MNLIPPDALILGTVWFPRRVTHSDSLAWIYNWFQTYFSSFHEIQWNLKDDDGGIANFVLKNFEYLSVSSGSYKYTVHSS